MADIAQFDGDNPVSQAAAPEAGNARGSIGWVLLLAGALVAAAVLVAFLDRETARPVILGLLSVLAVAGVFLLFALAVGMIRPVRQGAGGASAFNLGESLPRRSWSPTAKGASSTPMPPTAG